MLKVIKASHIDNYFSYTNYVNVLIENSLDVCYWLTFLAGAIHEVTDQNTHINCIRATFNLQYMLQFYYDLTACLWLLKYDTFSA